MQTDSPIGMLPTQAAAAAERLRRRAGPLCANVDDVRQDLMLDLLKRLHHFDSERGSVEAFAAVVFRHRASRIAGQLMRERRASGGPLLSLDILVGPEPLVETLPDETDTALADAGRRIDVVRAVSRLPRRDRALCAAVTRWPVDHLAAHGFGSRAGLYRRLRELRCVFAAHGLRAA